MKQQKLIYLISLLLLISGCSIQKINNNSLPQSKNRSVVGELPVSQPAQQRTVVVRDSHDNKKTKKCADYELPVKQAIQAGDLEQLEDLLFALNRLPDCPVSYLEAVKQSMAQIAAARADELTQQGQLTNAQSWLRRAPTMVWGTQVVYGDIAARRHQWRSAAQFYNQAIDLIADPQITPQAPPQAIIKRVYQLAYEAQLLSGNLEATIDSTGSARGAMRNKIRGIELKKRPLPIIKFDIGQITIDKQGQKYAQQLATYLKRQNVTQVTLIGHTDSKGNHAINEKISKQRALTVKKYLQQLGVTAHIMTLGKGETEPLPLANVALYTPDEIDALNRRVEFLMQ